MPQPLYVLEAVDLRRANEADSSRAITVATLALPAITYKTTSYAPGGGGGEVNWRLPQIDPPEPKFGLKGLDVDIMKRMGSASGQDDKWILAGAYRRKQGGTVVPARCIIQGVINSWEPDEFSVGEFFGCNYTFQEVVHYEFHLAGEELWYWDLYERVNRSGGVDRMAEIRDALGA